MGPSKYGPGEAKGAPWHPHRGFETVTYMLKGELQHQDSLGNKEQLRNGDVQWMTAASGIIHDESPSPDMMKLGGVMHGFQLWVNLPKSKKMSNPNYQGLSHQNIPKVNFPGGYVKVIAGEAKHKKSKVSAIINTQVPIQFLDVFLNKEGVFYHHFPL
jgi:quercetin 2,3-dioxygenase